MIQYDLQNAYYSIPVAQDQQNLQCVSIDGQVYRIRGLVQGSNMGRSVFEWAASAFIEKVKQECARQCIFEFSIHRFVDDITVTYTDKPDDPELSLEQEAEKILAFIKIFYHCLKEFGFKPNMKKLIISRLGDTTDFLGYTVTLGKGYSISQKAVDRYMECVTNLEYPKRIKIFESLFPLWDLIFRNFIPISLYMCLN